MKISKFLLLFVFTLIISNFGCSSYNLDERPTWAFFNPDGNNLREMNYPQTQYLTFVGMGVSNTIHKARVEAERDALRQLSETIHSRISTVMSFETKMLKKAGIFEKSTKMDTYIKVKSENDIPNFKISECWDEGIDHDDRNVAYVLGVLDLFKALQTVEKKCNLILNKSKQSWSNIKDFYEKKTPEKFPVLLRTLTEEFDKAKLNFPLYFFLAGKKALKEADELSSIKVEFRTLIAESLSRLTYKTTSDLVFLRGDVKSQLKLQMLVPYNNLEFPMHSTKFNVKTERSENTYTTDLNGNLVIPIPISHNLKSGKRELFIQLWLKDADITKDSELNDLEKKVSLTITYELQPDFSNADIAYNDGQKLIQQKSWHKAIQQFNECKTLTWDVKNYVNKCTKDIAYCRFYINWEAAEQAISEKEYQTAISSLEACKREANIASIPNEYDKANLIWAEIIYVNGQIQLKSGNRNSREYSLKKLQQISGSFRRNDVANLILLTKKKLPCLSCGFTGKCQVCYGAGRIHATCKTCNGEKRIFHICKVCNGTGKEKCPTCNGKGFWWDRCVNCNGTGTIRCPRCLGKGTFRETCTKCNGSGVIERVINKRVTTTQCPDCWGKGFHERSCSKCSGKGVLKCPVCNTGYGSKKGYVKQDCPNCSNGKIACTNSDCVNGRIYETCPECHGKGKVYYPCRNCNSTGVCPTCHGLGHRP